MFHKISTFILIVSKPDFQGSKSKKPYDPMKANILGGKKKNRPFKNLRFVIRLRSTETDQINKHDMKGKFAIKRGIRKYKDG